VKIALVHYAASPVIGGVERVMEEHARLFFGAGHDVTIFCQRGGSASEGIRVAALFGNPAQALAGFDVVFIHNVLTMPFDMALTSGLRDFASASGRTRVIAWTHDVAAANPDLTPVPALLSQPAPSVEWVAVSELRRRQLRELLGVRDCRVIPNGVDPARVLALPDNVRAFVEERQLLDGRLVFLHPTRLLRRKNVELGIEIVKALGDAVLVITGAEDPHNPASAAYSARLRDAADDCVIFAADHFPVRDEELSALYRLADLLMFPSRHEGFGLPLLEARLNRLPAVYANIEPLDEIAGVCGFPISPNESAPEIAGRLKPWIAANPHIRDRRDVIGRFSWRAIYRRHLVPLLDGEPDSSDK
jgi:glycosyltransferase involved in cell wall biosynthesis